MSNETSNCIWRIGLDWVRLGWIHIILKYDNGMYFLDSESLIGNEFDYLISDIDKEYMVLASAIGPSHAYVHVVEYNTDVNLFGLTIKPNDIY